MRVLFVTGLSDLPEAHLAKGLAARGVEVRILASKKAIYFPIWEQAGLRVDRLEIHSRVDRAAVAALREAASAFQPDVVHTFNTKALSSALHAFKRESTPRIVAYRGTTGHLHWWDFAIRMSYLHSRVDAISCVADAVREDLLRHKAPAEKLVTIRKGHRLEWYAGAAPPARGELGLKDEALVIGCIANMRAVKGIPVLLEAISLIPADIPVQVALVGEVRDHAVRAVQQVGSLAGRVVFTGYRADATRLIPLFDVFTMPSLDREGLPKAAVEAMAQGVPPVVSDAGGLPELVEDGVSGLVVPAGCAKSLADALARVLRDAALRKQLAAGARAQIAGRFSFDRTVGETLRLYERLCAGQPASADAASVAPGL
ncbi:MAG TPA: glycosyltransferase family 4 protein [Kiritimatiellia bacterium]|nr:glycosyltransferase family 4 protein [Kiritimatiellia bacterium]